MMDAELASATMVALLGPCQHTGATPVEAGGQTVAWLCPRCDTRLPHNWSGTTGDTVLKDPLP